MSATCRMSLTKYQIAEHLFVRGTSHILLPDGQRGYVQSVQREDGSGRSFNLTVALATGGTVGVYVTTID